METLGTLKKNADKNENKEKRMTSSRCLNPIVYPFRVHPFRVVLVKGLKEKVRDRWFWRKPIYRIAKSQHNLDGK